MASTSTPPGDNVCVSKQILRRVYRKIKAASENGSNSEIGNVLGRAEKLTGLQRNVLKQLQANNLKFEYNELDRAGIHNEYVNMILEHKLLPTSKHLFNALFGKIPPHIEIGTFRKILLDNGYIWIKKHGLPFAIIEKPSVSYERYKYLKRLFQYQEKQMPIIFIGEFEVTDDASKSKNVDFPNRLMYAATQTNIVHYEEIRSRIEFKDFLVHNLPGQLVAPSVVVLGYAEHHCEKYLPDINEDSLRDDMKQWLDIIKIPYCNEMTKAELYALIEKYHKPVITYVVDHILDQKGHVVLRLPEHISLLSPTYYLNKLIEENLDDSTKTFETVSEILNSVTAEHLYKYFSYVLNEKKKILEQDIKIDEVFDSVLAGMKQIMHEDMEDSDVPDFNDSG